MLFQTLTTYYSLFLQNIDKNGTKMFLESSPKYPSLMSVLQTLKYAGLEAQAGQCDWDYLRNITNPFLLHLNSGKKQNLIIAKWDSNQNAIKIYSHKTKNWKIKDREDITRYWDGVVIYTDTTPLKNQTWARTKYISFAALALSLFVLLSVYFNKLEILQYIPLVVGLTVSIFLYLKSEIDESGIYRLCHIGIIMDCDKVESSKYSSIYGLKMSCLSLAFFVAQTACVSIGWMFGIEYVLHSLYAFSAIISLPVIAYSVYGQSKTRRFCLFCITTDLCVAIEALIFIALAHQTINARITTLFCIAFIIVVSALHYIYTNRQKERSHLAGDIDLLKLKRRKDVLLTESQSVKTTCSPMTYGEEASDYNITTVISPNCSHCRKVVYEVQSLRKKGMRFKWDIILGQSTQDDSDMIDYWISHYLIDKDSFYEYLTHWSNGTVRTIPPITHRLKKHSDTSEIKSFFDRMKKELNTKGFPQIIFNDRVLSALYTPKDFEYLLIDHNI